jgi:RNA ligase (TIGR02306 family)
MSDWVPQIVRIEKVEQHPYADTLSIATVLGDYPVVIKTGDYQVDDLAGYLPIDTITTDTEPFYFLCPKAYEKYEEDGEIKQRQVGNKYPLGSVPERYRIVKAKKIRNVYSQGMLVKMPEVLGFSRDGSVYTADHLLAHDVLDKLGSLNVGDSIVDLLDLKKWEEPEEENLPSVKKGRGINAEKAPQGWAIPHYDINGIRKYVDALLPDEQIVLTEKLHGSNAAFTHDGTRLWSKSRNFYKKMDTEDMWWDIAIRYDLENKLSKFPMMVFFGEIAGQIKGFRYDSKIENGQLLTVIYFFDIWDSKRFRYLDYDDRVAMIRSAGLSTVPELYRGPWLGKVHAYQYAEGQSTLNSKHLREGAVLVPLKERYEPRLDSRLQLKIVGEGYNLLK